jgi:hypothetical protein
VAPQRLVDSRHFVSDVAFGAAVGMSSGWTVVGTRGTHPASDAGARCRSLAA